MEMTESNTVGVYAIINNINNKIYIGSSFDIKSRFKNHKGALQRNIHCNSYLQRAWNKYGSTNFTFKILEKCSVEKQIETEQKYIDIYKITHKLYNIAPIAGTTLGTTRTDEVKQKMSDNKKGRRFRPVDYRPSEETKEKIRQANTGYRHAESSKELNRQAHLGNIMPEEAKRKIAEFQRTQTRSEETRYKMSQAKLGTVVSEETREKLRQANLGKTMSQANREALSKANKGVARTKGRIQTEEEKQRRSASAKLFHENKRKEKQISLILDDIMIPSFELSHKTYPVSQQRI